MNKILRIVSGIIAVVSLCLLLNVQMEASSDIYLNDFEEVEQGEVLHITGVNNLENVTLNISRPNGTVYYKGVLKRGSIKEQLRIGENAITGEYRISVGNGVKSFSNTFIVNKKTIELPTTTKPISSVNETVDIDWEAFAKSKISVNNDGKTVLAPSICSNGSTVNIYTEDWLLNRALEEVESDEHKKGVLKIRVPDKKNLTKLSYRFPHHGIKVGNSNKQIMLDSEQIKVTFDTAFFYKHKNMRDLQFTVSIHKGKYSKVKDISIELLKGKQKQFVQNIGGQIKIGIGYIPTEFQSKHLESLVIEKIDAEGNKTIIENSYFNKSTQMMEFELDSIKPDERYVVGFHNKSIIVRVDE